MTLISGDDVSHYQSTDAGIPGATYEIVKTSEGLGTDNPGGTPAHDAQVASARARGLTVGHYHFAAFGSAAAEADHFLALAKAQPGDLLALDAEKGGTTSAQRAAFCLAWLSRVAAATGALPFLYCNKSWHAALLAASPGLAKYPLWIATAGDPAGSPGITGWTLHQFSTAGGIDHDVANTSLSVYAIPGADTPVTPTEINAVADAVWSRFAVHEADGSVGPTYGAAMTTIYQGAKAANAPAVDPAALAAALAPLVHASVDVAALAAALAPAVSQDVVNVLTAHPLVPKA